MLRTLLRAIRVTSLLAVSAFVIGFAAFTETTTRHAPPDPPPTADGIIALTGGGGQRLMVAMALLDAGAAQRLLITGVNPSTTDEDVRRLAGGAEAIFDCCVDLDRAARTTLGNAQEADAWARTHGYASLIVVTSDYHMPRSLLEMRRALHGVTLHPYPVRRADLTGRPWWRDLGGARRLGVEYVKFLLILARDAVGARAESGAA